jgi:hypothetical protein
MADSYASTLPAPCHRTNIRYQQIFALVPAYPAKLLAVEAATPDQLQFIQNLFAWFGIGSVQYGVKPFNRDSTTPRSASFAYGFS